MRTATNGSCNAIYDNDGDITFNNFFLSFVDWYKFLDAVALSWLFHRHSLSSSDKQDMERKALLDYKERRENGDKGDSLGCFPQDGEFAWIEGTAKEDGCVYGKKRLANKSWKGFEYKYCYKVQYNSGDKDRAWMEEKDKRYLIRLDKEGTMETLEPEEFKKRSAENAQKNDELERVIN